MLALVLLAGSYFIMRSIERERTVARLQSEFVSAVSHEFRTPLTSLRQLSEMLSKGRIPTEDLRQKSYDILAHESDSPRDAPARGNRVGRRIAEELLEHRKMRAQGVAFRDRGKE